ncbi:MAG: DEAD/DEAH box helicase [Ignavibacteriaceae bacterium]|nr:DEAD/DEAH box helicase [Ignavibacteriaceae bacterium]
MKSVSKNTLDESVQYLKSVGPKRAESFSQIGLKTIRDLLYYFPSRHLDRTTVLSAAKAYGYLMNGYDGELTVIGKVFEKEKKRFGKKEILKVQFRDETGFFESVWFRGTKYFYSVFNEGDVFAISSKPDKSKYGALQFIHPDFDRISEEEKSFLHTGKIIPFYRIPKELKSGNIGDLSLRRIISFAVENYVDKVEETLPDEIIKQNKLISLQDAIRNYHFPESSDKLNSAQKRFKFEELFYLELLIALRKLNYQSKLIGNKMSIKTNLVKSFLKTLPFELTIAQLKVLGEIKNDLLSEKPMNRLLQGDVGSGKTIVSLIAMLIAVDNGYQSAIMAPTEILADQHAKNISSMMQKLYKGYPEREVKVSLLLGGQKKSERDKRLQEIVIRISD